MDRLSDNFYSFNNYWNNNIFKKMKFIYNIIDTDMVEVDFQEIFNYVSEELENPSTLDVFNDFAENAGYYIRSIYDDNFEEVFNELELEELFTAFENWLNEKFGEGWDDCD